jgi:hypothetical protein
MKYLIAILFICLSARFATAQNSKNATAFINEAVKANNSADSIERAAFLNSRGMNYKHAQPIPKVAYEDRVSKGIINSMREAIQRYKVAVFYCYREDNIFYIDSAGKKKIMSFWDLKRLDLRNYHKETIHIKSDSIRFTEFEIKHINDEIAKMDRYKWDKGLFADALLIPTDKINKIFADNILKGWAYLKAKHIDRLYSFAPPIFLRDNSYCLFYYSYGCGDLCGQGEFALYKKGQGKWVKIMVLTSSVS